MVIADAEIARTAQGISNAARQLETYAGYLAAHLGQLQDVGAIDSDATQKALSEDIDAIKGMAENVLSSMSALVGRAGDFIRSVDEIDSFAR